SFHVHGTVFTQAHDGAFTELLFDLAQCCRQRFLFVFVDSHYYSCHAGRSNCASPWTSVLLRQLYCIVIQYQVFCRNCCQSVFNAYSVASRRTLSRSPLKHSRRVIPSPFEVAKPNQTVPTGFTSLPPSGPAIPLMEIA